MQQNNKKPTNNDEHESCHCGVEHTMIEKKTL